MEIVVLLPLLVMLILVLRNKHMILAGLVGGLTAMLVGGIGFSQASKIVMTSIPGMTGIITPVIYSAVALVLAKLGGFEALLGLSRRVFGRKQYLIAAAIVLTQALATYAAGLGAGNTMVTGPLALAIVGAVPQLIAGMAIVTAASFMTSPSGADAAAISKIANIEIATYSDTMFPITVCLWTLGMTIAAFGVWKSGSVLQDEDTMSDVTLKEQLIKVMPPVYFLVVVVAGKNLNELFDYSLFSPIFNMFSTLMLGFAVTRQSPGKLAEELVQNSSFLLTKLFAIGIFLGFINILAEIGTFTYIAEFIKSSPAFVTVPVAVFIAFCISIPAGGYSVGVSTLVMPIMVESGLSITQIGLAALAVGVGTQMSPVQINVASLSQSFKLDIQRIVKINAPYMAGVAAILCIMGFFL
ncbi:hypothetical protein RZR10_24020 [Enterobacter asburiae]|jgi:hypothetical protein|uniref:Anaerobic C4-dicarboxylate transporter DcuC n=9 Tax=Enterobacteriaceae TaxID=543 RepID=A0A7G9A7U2_RAOOR|nr:MULTISPECIES: hypothetical protein [Enterobacteriaceae]ELU0480224.1 hypothetical protein [Salmonella enterica subsp. enterica]MDR7943343.1 hypothetical protein [Enterobacter soli]QFH73102.1 hypothetical protein FR762_25465 [Enterobacter sp. E76]QZS49802.1 hypothetical protein K6966_25025 [Enterobacter cloacae complex sp.]HBQ3828455.1 hypothetical protein [Salmonella enterica subsp. enterica serovar Senftenberg]HCB0093759.1 hypothetical protein [Klebsiella variicola subsp. variicola]HCC616